MDDVLNVSYGELEAAGTQLDNGVLIGGEAF
ncbi:hypothetical protein FHU41_001221 [Psychromicrobium silvestre]|uniref:Uncharacterized protein n=1 Tax=Psychromicrobium silvestre TaxID=1645614 RepID=A0A7Y9S6H3_9MICC|nr:hypothetical protein [Psychromicrobium silvestre]